MTTMYKLNNPKGAGGVITQVGNSSAIMKD